MKNSKQKFNSKKMEIQFKFDAFFIAQKWNRPINNDPSNARIHGRKTAQATADDDHQIAPARTKRVLVALRALVCVVSRQFQSINAAPQYAELQSHSNIFVWFQFLRNDKKNKKKKEITNYGHSETVIPYVSIDINIQRSQNLVNVNINRTKENKQKINDVQDNAQTNWIDFQLFFTWSTNQFLLLFCFVKWIQFICSLSSTSMNVWPFSC